MQAPKELNQSKEQELLEECGAGLIGHGLEADHIYDGLLVQAAEAEGGGEPEAEAEAECVPPTHSSINNLSAHDRGRLEETIKLMRATEAEAAAAADEEEAFLEEAAEAEAAAAADEEEAAAAAAEAEAGAEAEAEAGAGAAAAPEAEAEAEAGDDEEQQQRRLQEGGRPATTLDGGDLEGHFRQLRAAMRKRKRAGEETEAGVWYSCNGHFWCEKKG